MNQNKIKSNKYCLQWEHAWKGRLETYKDTLQISPTKILHKLQQAHKNMALPFISMDYQKELELQLKTITPLLTKFKHMLLLGIGGSALGAKTLQKAFFPQQDQPNHTGKCLWIIDNINNDYLTALFNKLNPKETLVVTISKSGETLETIAQYFLVKEWLKKTLGKEWKQQNLCITSSDRGFLKKESEQNHIPIIPIPKNLGGRYSILSAVALIPAVFLGIPWEPLLAGAHEIMQPLKNPNIQTLQEHPAWHIAQWCYALMQNNYTQLIFFTYIPQWAIFGQWFTQLWAESLGKEGKGSMPIAAVGVTSQHSIQQMFLDGPKNNGCILLSTILNSSGLIFPETLSSSWSWLQKRHLNELLEAEKIGTAAALTTKNIPLLQLQLTENSYYTAGTLIALCLTSTLFTGWLLNINPLDQPAVELGKRLTQIQLGAKGSTSDRTILQNFFQQKKL